jgi:hypothetical protein
LARAKSREHVLRLLVGGGKPGDERFDEAEKRRSVVGAELACHPIWRRDTRAARE